MSIENLIRNSREHGGTDVTVTVGGINLDQSERYLDPQQKGFYFEDDGRGFTMDNTEKVLEEGYTTNDDGTGLGMTIVQQIVEAHGWELQLADSESGGARFEVVDIDHIEIANETADRHPQSA